MTHNMKLNPSPFELIKSGKKTIELRLYDEKRRLLKVGDRIIFTKTDSHDTLEVTVTKLHIFDNFKELYEALPLDKCGYTEANITTAHYSDMNAYYSESEQEKWGVVGVEVALCAKAEESAMAVVFCQGKLLTTKEMIYGTERLSLPKGHVEENETSLKAAIRECYEETNILIDESDLIKALTPYSYEFLTPSNRLIKKTLKPYLFEVKDFGLPVPKEDRMISVEWMNVEDFLALCTYDNVKDVVKEAIQVL